MAEMVKYIGTAGRRIISVDDWRARGVMNMSTVEWNRMNMFQVPRNTFTDQAWPLIEADRNMVVVGEPTIEPAPERRTKEENDDLGESSPSGG